MDWSEHFYYDESSPSCLRRAIDVLGLGGRRKLCTAGDIAGSISAVGYYVVSFQNKRYYVHRIIWEMLNNTSVPDECEVDHINRDRLCNKKDNLRVVTRQVNSQNHTIRSDNTSGVTGVHITDNGKQKYWTADYMLEGKNMKKHFSINKLGYEGAFKAAVEFRKKILDNLNCSGCFYTTTHGI